MQLTSKRPSRGIALVFSYLYHLFIPLRTVWGIMMISMKSSAYAANPNLVPILCNVMLAPKRIVASRT